LNLGILLFCLAVLFQLVTLPVEYDASHRAVTLLDSTGILAGQGTGQPLEVNFVQRATRVNEGEILITSGLDGKYPKGIPVARVLSVAPSDYTQFMAIKAEPLVDLHHLEEVLLLEPTGVAPPPDLGAPPKEIHGPPTPGRPAP